MLLPAIFGSLFLFGAIRWRHSIFLALFLVAVEGAVRKWLLQESQEYVYFFKDFLLLGAYLGYCFAARPVHRVSILAPVSLIFVVLCYGFIQMFNPNLPSLAVGLFGLKNYFFYLPLMFIGPKAFGGFETWPRKFFWYAMFAIPICALGIVQYYSPINSPLVQYLDWGQDASQRLVSLVVLHPRISGTFSYISGYSSYLVIVGTIWLTLINGNQSLSGPLVRPVSYFGLFLVGINMIMTGSRWPTLLFVGTAVALPLLASKSEGRSILRRIAPLVSCIGGVVLLTFLIFPAALSELGERSMNAEDFGYRIWDSVARPFLFAIKYSPFGYGIGSTHQAVTALVPNRVKYSWLPTSEFELEPERIMLELGLVGFVAIYSLKGAFILNGIRILLREQNATLRSLRAGLVVFSIGNLTAFTVFHPISSLFYWLSTGLMLSVFSPQVRNVEVMQGSQHSRRNSSPGAP